MPWCKFCLCATLLASGCTLAFAKSDTFSAAELEQKYQLELITDKVEIPWAIEQLPDYSLLITDRQGKLLRWHKGFIYTITGVPAVHAKGQGGLLDVVLHPNFKHNKRLYLSYTYPKTNSGQNTAIASFTLINNALSNQKQLYRGDAISKRTVHYGSRIAIQSPYIYFTIGDRGHRDKYPQDIHADAGKVFRINEDGSIPKDNPFIDAQTQQKSAVYSYGHRNPQGLAFDVTTNTLWSHEHGPRGGDEINIIKKGGNYEWPLASFGINYSGSTFTDKTKIKGGTSSIWYWTPSIAPSDMIFVSSNKYPELTHQLLIGSLKFQKLVLMLREREKVVSQIDLFEKFGRVRSVQQGLDGFIYIGFDSKGVYRLTAKNKSLQ